jgi:hypothetical protein
LTERDFKEVSVVLSEAAGRIGAGKLRVQVQLPKINRIEMTVMFFFGKVYLFRVEDFVQVPGPILYVHSFARFLNSRQQQPDKHRDDCDYPDKFEQRESALRIAQEISLVIRHDIPPNPYFRNGR